MASRCRKTKQNNLLRALFRRETNCCNIGDQQLLLSYAEDSTVMSCYRMEECDLSGSPRSTFLVCFSPDKTKMASTHGDHTVRIVDCKTGRCLNTLQGHPRTPWCVAFHPSSNELLASGCLGGQVRVWNLKTGDSEVYTPPDGAVIASLAFHPSDHVLLIATTNKLYFWRWDKPEPFACVQTASAEEKVRLVTLSPLGDHILTGVTNSVPQVTNHRTDVSRASLPMNPRVLESISSPHAGNDQFAAYVLRPSLSSDSASSTGNSSASYSISIAETDNSTTSANRQATSSSPCPPPASQNNQTNQEQREPGTASEARTSSENRRENVTDVASRDYRGVFALFRARRNNMWNVDVTSSDGRTSAVVDRDAAINAVNIDSEGEENPGVTLSVSAEETELYSDASDITVDETSSTGSGSSEHSAPFGSEYFSSETLPSSDEPSETTNDSVVGVGRVINVGEASSRTSYLSHGSNHSSSFATVGGSQGSGTAVATATARTFRHVHTAVVVADGTNGGPQFALRTAINRAIAGAFAGCGEGAVASNIISTTHRLQWWDFGRATLPGLENSDSHVIVPSCKIHNDASCCMSNDGRLLAAFVPSSNGFPDDGMVAVYSLEKENLGQCLFTKKFGPNAISVSLSPLNRFIMVGLAARRLHWHLTSRQMVAQIFRLGDKDTPTESIKPVMSVMHDCEVDRRSHVSVNSAFFHPLVGSGLVYGTNRGHLRMRNFGAKSTTWRSQMFGTEV